MKYLLTLCALILSLTAAVPTAWAAGECYPTTVTQSEDGAEIRKIYDLSTTDDPAGISRSDFEQNGWHYTLTDLLRQETPEYQERQHTEEVHVTSSSKDMGAILELLPQEKEIVTEDGLSGVVSLQLSSIQIEVAGYGKSTKEKSVTRTYSNLDSQDTQYIPKTIVDNGSTMTLQDINWTSGLAAVDDFTTMERYTAVAVYTGTVTSSYVKGYNVSAVYTGTVSRIAMDRVRYVAIFQRTTVVPELEVSEPTEGTGQLPEQPGETSEQETPSLQFNWEFLLPETTSNSPSSPDTPSSPNASFNWASVLTLAALLALAGVGISAALYSKRRKDVGTDEDGKDEDSP